mgnify:CR=1 FL=1
MSDEQEFAMLMPFVTVASRGGPHDDPASFRHQLEQARAAIRELLEFIDTKDALIRDLCETVIWLDSDECNDAHEWPAFVKRCRGILTSGYEVPT